MQSLVVLKAPVEVWVQMPSHHEFWYILA